MMYCVEYTKTAVKQLKKMDRKLAAFIIAYIDENLVNCENPRQYGKALKGGLNDIWRYRVGEYRILAKIEDERLIIAIVEIGHHKDVYK
jgi:mRNA interferase RelE/StbE